MNPKVDWFLKRPAYQRGLMIVGVLLLIVGLFVYFLYLPEQGKYNLLVQESDNLERQLINDRKIAANLPVFQAEYEKMQESLKEALKQLPNDKEIPTLLTSIAATAKENGLEVLYFKPGVEVPKGFYAEVPVSLKLVGSYHQLAMFFYDIGSLPRIVNLGDVNMGGPKQVGGHLRLSISCLATTFRFLDQK